MKAGYLTFGRDDFSYGQALVMSGLQCEKYRVTPKTARLVDVLLFSCFWWEHIYLLADFLRRARLKKGSGPRIIAGGFNSFNPVPLSCYADTVVVGDGESIIDDALAGHDNESFFYTGKRSCTYRTEEKLRGFSHETNNVTRIEIARGCRFKCRFCAVAHLKKYSEIEVEEIKPLIAQSKTKKIALFAPEPTLHSKNIEISECCLLHGKSRLDTDVRLDRINKRHDEGGLLRCGIEGVSERLRKTVNKGYSNQQILETIKEGIENDRPGMLFYLILDLPGEEQKDFEEFLLMLHEVEKIEGCEKFLLVPSPSVFMPSPHTPMEYDAINFERSYRDLWQNLFRASGEKERPWKFMLAERTRVFAPAARVLSMLSTRCGEEFFDIEKELTAKKIISVSGGRVQCRSLNALISCLKKYGGVEKYCGKYTEDQAPWKVVKMA